MPFVGQSYNKNKALSPAKNVSGYTILATSAFWSPYLLLNPQFYLYSLDPNHITGIYETRSVPHFLQRKFRFFRISLLLLLEKLVSCKCPIYFDMVFLALKIFMTTLLKEINVNWKMLSSSFLLLLRNVFVNVKDEVKFLLLLFIK